MNVIYCKSNLSIKPNTLFWLYRDSDTMTSVTDADQQIQKFCGSIIFITPIAGNIKRSLVLLMFGVNT